ncbi:MAG: non-canonical purine NTP pyrophosphatase [Candidatus Levyibacteriota bacterium]
MIYYITSNRDKVENANIILRQHGLSLTAKNVPFIEIQTDSLEEIALHKAKQAFGVVKKPLVVNDTGWEIKALRGFPGVYMQYVNNWFTAEDFLNLIKPYRDRTVIMRQAVYYIDSEQAKLFFHEIKGIIVKTPKGKGRPSETIFSFRPDGKTLAECQNDGIHFTNDNNSIWNDFAKWYKTQS